MKAMARLLQAYSLERTEHGHVLVENATGMRVLLPTMAQGGANDWTVHKETRDTWYWDEVLGLGPIK